MVTNRVDQHSKNDIIAGFKLDEIFEVITRKWKFICLFAFLCAVCTAAITLFIPNKYTAKSTILPTTNDFAGGALSSLAEGIPGLEMMGLNFGGQSSSALFPEILKSHQLAEKVLKQKYSYQDGDKLITQDLYDYWGVETPDEAYDKLHKYTSISYDKKTGVVNVSVTTKNAELSSKVANNFIHHLDDFNMNQRKTGAGLNQGFIEKRIIEAELELKKTEEALKEFRESNLNYYSSTDPELLMMHDRLLRDMQMQNQIYLTLKQQLEIATIQAKKELPVVQVLDEATPPSLKSSPARAKITVIGMIMGLLTALAYAVLEYMYNVKYRSDNVREFIKKLRLVNPSSQVEKSEYVH